MTEIRRGKLATQQGPCLLRISNTGSLSKDVTQQIQIFASRLSYAQGGHLIAGLADVRLELSPADTR